MTRYLADARPAGLYPVGETANLLAVTARHLSNAPTRVVAGIHAPVPRRRLASGPGKRWRARPLLRGARRALHRADAIVAVSRGLADEWAREAAAPRSRIAAIHHPVVGEGLAALAAAPLDYPWFREPGPRLSSTPDASRPRRTSPRCSAPSPRSAAAARPGWRCWATGNSDPRSAGWPTGYGRLVPVGDWEAMAEAILATLARPPERAVLRRRGAWFSEDRAARSYARFLPPVRIRFGD